MNDNDRIVVTLGRKIESAYDPPYALLLVDLQNGFVNALTPDPLDDSPAITRGKLHDVAARCDVLANCGVFSTVVCTAFHNTPDSPFQTLLHWNGLSTPEECELYGRLGRRADAIISKDRYAVQAADVMQAINQCQMGHTANEVFVAGVDTDACVYAACISLFDAGMQPVLLADCCYSTGGSRMHESGMLLIRRQIGDANVLSMGTCV